MYTTLTGTSEIDTGELQAKIAQLQQEAAHLQSQLDALNAENSELLRKMSQATTTEEYNQYQATYNSNKQKIRDLQSQLDTINKTISEAEEGERAQTDDYTRIPQLMKSMKDAYGITWTDNGSWTGYTFIRNGTVGSVKGTVTFKATVSIARRPKYFLGIKIHRAIVQIDWELTSSWSDTSVAETMELDPSKTDDENAAIVNQRLSELAQEYPSCTVSVEYSRRPGLEIEDTDGC